MVIACNTATAAALRLAQQVLDVPVIGVIAPGARAAINSTRTRRVGVLATNLTIRSGAYTRAIQDLDAGVDVYGCPASSFVEVVEHELASGAHLQEQWLENEDIFDTPAVRALVGATVEPLHDRGIDTVVLGCTHFPLLVGPIRHALGPGVRVVSSAEETTRELTDILTRREQLAGDTAEPQHRFATTSDNIAEFAVAGSFIFGQPLKSIEHVDIDELGLGARQCRRRLRHIFCRKDSSMEYMQVNRANGRAANELRPIKLTRGVMKHAHGSCLAEFGDTRVLCAATIEEGVPGWRKGAKAGWVTAEYAMLPASTGKRCKREHANRKGRSMEIERLIGRSLRTVVNMKALGEYTVTVDCDVIQADGGTRTASITGAWLALHDALAMWVEAGKLERIPLTGQVAAISMGVVDGNTLLDLDYSEDSHAEVDMNLVATDTGEMIELQGTGEQAPFDRKRLNALLDLGDKGIAELIELQRQALA